MSIINMIGKGPIRPLNEHENFHFVYAQNIQMNSENYEANGYGHDLDLLIDLH